MMPRRWMLAATSAAALASAACGAWEIGGATRVQINVEGRADASVDAIVGLESVELVPCRSAWRDIADALQPIPVAHAAHLQDSPTRAMARIDVQAQQATTAWATLTPPATSYCGVTVGAYGREGATLEVTIDGEVHTTTRANDRTWSIDLDLQETQGAVIDIVFTPTQMPQASGDTETMDNTLLQWAFDAIDIAVDGSTTFTHTRDSD